MEPLYHFPRSSETVGSDSFENPGKVSTFFFTFFYFLTSAIKHSSSCYETNYDARFWQFFTFSFTIASFHDFKILTACSSVVIILTITMNIYNIITLRVRSNNIFSYLQGLLIQLNMSMGFANCTKSVKDGLHPSPGVKSSDSTLITFLLDSK